MGAKANHHYVPQYYLRKFANGSGRKARVFTIDFSTKKSFKTLVRNVGSERYFFRIEAHTHDPNYVEDEFGKIESDLNIHLSEIIKAKCFPSPQHRNSLMNIIAILSARNPRLRKSMTESHQNLAEKVAHMTVQSEDRWHSIQNQMKRDGYDLDDGIGYNKIKDFVESGEYDIEIDQTYLVQMELKMIDPVLQACSKRNWRFISTEMSNPFITCDDPVILTFSDDRTVPYSPGHGLSNTLLYFPLCSELAVIGTFEEPKFDGVVSPAQVASANSLCAQFATKQVYAQSRDFWIRGTDGSLLTADEFMKTFRSVD